MPALNICRTLKVEFISDSQWLHGHHWSGATSRIYWAGAEALVSPLSIAHGSGFIGQSALEGNKEINIDIQFSTHTDSQSVAPVYSTTPDTGVFLGMGTFPGTVWDISNPALPRRINICFFERSEGGDLIWNPEHAAHGNYEYLLIMLSDYDEGIMYDGLAAYNLDVQYFCWLKKMAQETWFSTLPAGLQFRNFWDISLSSISSGYQVTLNWEHENPNAEIQEIIKYELFRGLDENPDTLISEFEVGINSFTDKNLVNYTPYYYQILGYNSQGDTLVASKVITATPFITQYHTTFISNWDDTDENPYRDWGITNYNDIWGYTGESGIEYALLGSWDGTYIIDISSNPSEPQEVAFVPGSFSTHRDIKTFGDHMYIGTEANLPDPDSLLNYDIQHIIPQGIQVVDLSDPHNPILVNEWDLIDQSHNIMEYNGYLYIVGSGSDVNGDGNTSDIIVLDLVSNPSIPTYVGEWSGHYLHDVCFKDNILYGCGIQTIYGGGFDDKMFALDITNPDSIVEIHQWGGVFAAHACWVSEDGNTLYTGQETTNGHIISWDVTDLLNGNVNQLSEWLPQGGENSSAHNLFVKGNYLYISYYVYGLQILDISDPTNMVHIGHYDTFVESSLSGLYDGAWGAYPYFDSNTVIVSDRYTGLYIVDFDPNNLFINSEPLLIPDQISIQNIYPNPFNPITNIAYNLPYLSNVSLTVYDLLGRQVEILHNGIQHPNNYIITWDADRYSSGVYLVQLIIQDIQYNDKSHLIQTQKIVLMK